MDQEAPEIMTLEVPEPQEEPTPVRTSSLLSVEDDQPSAPKASAEEGPGIEVVVSQKREQEPEEEPSSTARPQKKARFASEEPVGEEGKEEEHDDREEEKEEEDREGERGEEEKGGDDEEEKKEGSGGEASVKGKRPGKLAKDILCIIFVGPPGSDKTGVVEHLIKTHPDLYTHAQSHTTNDYYASHPSSSYLYVEDSLMQDMIEKKEVIRACEWMGHTYATSYGALVRGVEEGLISLLDVSLEGALGIVEKGSFKSIVVELIPPREHAETSIRERGFPADIEKEKLSELSLWYSDKGVYASHRERLSKKAHAYSRIKANPWHLKDIVTCFDNFLDQLTEEAGRK
jgi:guanylate kinase